MPITQVITALPTPPNSATDDSAAFSSKSDSFVAAQVVMGTEQNTLAGQMNTLAGQMNAAAAGAFAIDLLFSTTTAAADPGAGFIRLNNATQNLATALYLDPVAVSGADWTAAIDAMDDSTSTLKGYLMLRKSSDGSKFVLFSLASLTSPAGYKSLVVTPVASSSANPFANNDAVTLGFVRNGDVGQGNVGLAFNYSTTTAAADPGAGLFRLNNAAPASATALYISETAVSALAVGAELATWDDGGAAALRGHLKIVKEATSSDYMLFAVTGSVTDNGTWDTLNLTHINSSGTFADATPCRLQFTRAGVDGVNAELTSPTRVVTVTGSLTVADNGYIIDVTAGGVTLTLDTPASLGNGWSVFFKESPHIVTLTGAFSDGTTSKQVPALSSGMLSCNGTVEHLSMFGGGRGFRNKIINGKMDIAQRGASFAGYAAGGAYTLDRWHYSASGAIGSVSTVSQQADAPSDNEFQNSLRVAITTADAAIAAGDYVIMQQCIEGYDVRDLIGKSIALSFRVRSSKTGTHCVSLSNSANDRSYVATFTVNATNTWEAKTVIVPVGLITEGTWNWSNGAGLWVRFALAAGTTFQAAAGAWQVGNFLATANQVNCLDTVGNIFAITGVQLEAAPAATPFEHRHMGVESALCLRYYEIGMLRNNTGASTSYAGLSALFRQTKRSTPTVTFKDAAGNASKISTSTGDNVGISAGGLGVTSAVIYMDAITTTALGSWWLVEWTASAEL